MPENDKLALTTFWRMENGIIEQFKSEDFFEVTVCAQR